jgi:ribosomal protein S18 acetylase RimI-like enzyme
MKKETQKEILSSLFVRKATPEDVHAIVPLIHSSGPKAWEYVFTEAGLQSIDFLKSAYLQRGNTISYTNHYVAVLENRVVGSILCYKQPKFIILTLGTFIRICISYGINFLKVTKRGLEVETMIQPPKWGRLYLAHIAVSPETRNRGIAKQMVRYVIKNETRSKTISLDVSIENEPAIKLYHNLGFVVKETRKLKNNALSIPNHHYMEVDSSSIKI